MQSCHNPLIGLQIRVYRADFQSDPVSAPELFWPLVSVPLGGKHCRQRFELIRVFRQFVVAYPGNARKPHGNSGFVPG